MTRLCVAGLLFLAASTEETNRLISALLQATRPTKDGAAETNGDERMEEDSGQDGEVMKEKNGEDGSNPSADLKCSSTNTVCGLDLVHRVHAVQLLDILRYGK